MTTAQSCVSSNVNQERDAILTKCRYKDNVNLLSLTKLLMDRWNMTGHKHVIIMRNGNAEISFDLVIKTLREIIFTAYLKRRNTSEQQGGMAVLEGSNISAEKAHDLMGHSHEDATRNIENHLGWELSCSCGAKPRQSCAEPNAKQKIVYKRSADEKDKKFNGMFFQDSVMIKVPKSLHVTVTRKH